MISCSCTKDALAPYKKVDVSPIYYASRNGVPEPLYVDAGLQALKKRKYVMEIEEKKIWGDAEPNLRVDDDKDVIISYGIGLITRHMIFSNRLYTLDYIKAYKLG